MIRRVGATEGGRVGCHFPSLRRGPMMTLLVLVLSLLSLQAFYQCHLLEMGCFALVVGLGLGLGLGLVANYFFSHIYYYHLHI